MRWMIRIQRSEYHTRKCQPFSTETTQPLWNFDCLEKKKIFRAV